MKSLNDKEQLLIRTLRNNSRVKINNLAKINNHPTSSLNETLHKLEKQNLLTHTSKINFDALGYHVKIFMTIKTQPNERDNTKKYLELKHNVNNLHIINSGYDFHFQAIFRNQKEMQYFLEDLDKSNKILEKHIYNIIDTVHTEKFLTKKEHFTTDARKTNEKNQHT